MFKKTVLTTVALGLVISGYSVISQAEGPIYDEQGELILDPVESEQSNIAPANVQAPSVQSTPGVQPTASVQPSSVITDGVSNEVYESQESTGPKMQPASLTYVAEEGGTTVSAGTAQVTDIKVAYSIGLAEGAWKKQGNNLVFDPDKLDESATGTYVFEVTFANGDKRIVDIRVIGKPFEELYWNQNLFIFNKDATSHQNKDLELVSNGTELKIQSLTIDEVPVPTAKYMVVGGTVIISKDYLNTLDLTERARINLVYNTGGVLDFSLEIIEEAGQSFQQTPIDC